MAAPRIQWCDYCGDHVDTRQDGEFLFCLNCGSNLGPADPNAAIQFGP